MIKALVITDTPIWLSGKLLWVISYERWVMQPQACVVPSMSRTNKLIMALVGSLVMCCSATVAQEAMLTNSDQEVIAAQQLIDSYGGRQAVLEQAHERLERVLQAAPNNPQALLQLARYQLRTGFIDEHQLVNNGPYSYSINVYAPGTLAQAKATITKAIAAKPNFADALVLLAHMQIDDRSLDAAAATLTRAEAIGSTNPWLQLNWATVLFATGKSDKGRERLQRALNSSAFDASAKSWAIQTLIDYYDSQGNYNQAVNLYRDQVRVHPGDVYLHGNLAAYLTDTLDRNDEAVSEARAALAIYEYPEGKRILAMALYRKWANLVVEGKSELAQKYFDEALALFPNLDLVMAYGASMPAGKHLADALIHKKGVLIDAPAEDRSTALLIATNRNRVAVVKTLLALNANPNVHDNNGWTPLLSAADAGNAKIVELLLAKGADPQVTLQGHSATAFAAKHGYTGLADRLAHAEGLVTEIDPRTASFDDAKALATRQEAALSPSQERELTASRVKVTGSAFAACMKPRPQQSLGSFAIIVLLDKKGKAQSTWLQGGDQFASCINDKLATSTFFKPPRAPFFLSFEYPFTH